MCEYCYNKKMLFKSLRSEVFICMSSITNLPVIDITQGGYNLCLNIHYCPMCGRKLTNQ